MPEQSKCRSCGKTILWVRSAKTGSLMPLDAEPSEKGNILIVEGKAVVKSNDLFEEMLPEGPLYLSHFATCSSPELHRKKGGGK